MSLASRDWRHSFAGVPEVCLATKLFAACSGCRLARSGAVPMATAPLMMASSDRSMQNESAIRPAQALDRFFAGLPETVDHVTGPGPARTTRPWPTWTAGGGRTAISMITSCAAQKID